MATQQVVPQSGTWVVILNWNGATHTLRCLQSLFACVPPLPVVLVIDNGSTDGSMQRLEAGLVGLGRPAVAQVRLLRVERNLGYSGGNNLGIRLALDAGAERVVLVNNDVELAPDTIATLERALAADPGIGVAGPLILLPGPDLRVWAAGGELTYRENVTRLRGCNQALNGRFARDEDVDYVPGCVLMVRREVFETVGLLDDTFFCYMEDVEFGHRVREAGFRNRYVAGTRVVHAASASTGGGYTPARKYMNAVNSVHYLRRHPTLRGWLGFFTFDVLALPLSITVALCRGRGAAGVAKLRGVVDGLLGRHVTPARVARYVDGCNEPPVAPPAPGAAAEPLS